MAVQSMASGEVQSTRMIMTNWVTATTPTTPTDYWTCSASRNDFAGALRGDPQELLQVDVGVGAWQRSAFPGRSIPESVPSGFVGDGFPMLRELSAPALPHAAGRAAIRTLWILRMLGEIAILIDNAIAVAACPLLALLSVELLNRAWKRHCCQAATFHSSHTLP
jgi:hypothetical protein